MDDDVARRQRGPAFLVKPEAVHAHVTGHHPDPTVEQGVDLVLPSSSRSRSKASFLKISRSAAAGLTSGGRAARAGRSRCRVRSAGGAPRARCRGTRWSR